MKTVTDRDLRARLARHTGAAPRAPKPAGQPPTDRELRARIARLQDDHLVDQMARLVDPVAGMRLKLQLQDARVRTSSQQRSEAVVAARELAQNAWSAARG